VGVLRVLLDYQREVVDCRLVLLNDLVCLSSFVNVADIGRVLVNALSS
jgi:hypothetical protein